MIPTTLKHQNWEEPLSGNRFKGLIFTQIHAITIDLGEKEFSHKGHTQDNINPFFKGFESNNSLLSHIGV